MPTEPSRRLGSITTNWCACQPAVPFNTYLDTHVDAEETAEIVGVGRESGEPLRARAHSTEPLPEVPVDLPAKHARVSGDAHRAKLCADDLCPRIGTRERASAGRSARLARPACRARRNLRSPTALLIPDADGCGASAAGAALSPRPQISCGCVRRCDGRR
jgi:hypothetical protein